MKKKHNCLDCCSIEEWDKAYQAWKAKVLKENMKKKSLKKRISKRRGKNQPKKIKTNSFGLVARLI